MVTSIQDIVSQLNQKTAYEGREGGWAARYKTGIDEAVAKAANVGIDISALGEKYKGLIDVNGAGAFGEIASKFVADSINTIREEKNRKTKEYADAGLIDYTVTPTNVQSGNYDDFASELGAFQKFTTEAEYNKNKTEEQKKKAEPPRYQYNPEQDELANQVQREMQSIIDRGEPKFASPEFSTQYVDQWNQKLTELEQPNIDWALGQINKTVRGQYAFSNPWSIGSGAQIKATEDAATNLLMTTIANRNAKALSLGEAQYQRDYNKALDDFQYKKMQREAALGGIQEISRYREQAKRATTDQQRADYYDLIVRQRQLADMEAQKQYELDMYRRQREDAQRLAEMYASPKRDELKDTLMGALTGAATGFAYGGPQGAAIGAGVGGLSGYMGGGTQSAGQLGGAAGYGFSRYQPQPRQSFYGGLYSANPNLNISGNAPYTYNYTPY